MPPFGIAFSLASGALEPLERESLKARFDVRGTEPVTGMLVVGIDAKTFGDLQVRWPFRRSLHARAVRRLSAAGARAIVYDVQFTERTRLRDDLALFKRSVMGAGPCSPRAKAIRRATPESSAGTPTSAASARAPPPRTSATTRGGAIASFPRSAGKLDSIAVVTAERLSGRTPDSGGFRDNKAWINFRGPPGTIPTVSFSDVVEDRVPAERIRDRIVVVGAAAPTLRDVHSTPVGGEELMAGAEVQANAIWTALHGLPPRSAPLGLDLLLLVLLAMLAPPRVRDRTIVEVAAPLVALLIGAFGAIA